MTLRLPTLFTATAVLICSLLTVARPVDAAIVTLQFDGTVDVAQDVLFGASPSAPMPGRSTISRAPRS